MCYNGFPQQPLHESTYVRVVILADLPHSDQGLGVRVGVMEMEGRSCEVYTHSEVDLTTSHHKVQEGVQLSCLDQDGGGEGKRRKCVWVFILVLKWYIVLLNDFLLKHIVIFP